MCLNEKYHNMLKYVFKCYKSKNMLLFSYLCLLCAFTAR